VRTLPFVATLAVAIFLQIVEEQFPFSQFPMYSGFSNETTVIYLTDVNETLIPVHPYFRLSSAKVKKTFNTELKKICRQKGYSESEATPEDLTAAGNLTLSHLVRNPRDARYRKKLDEHGLRMHRTTLRMNRKKGDDHGFQQDTVTVGEWRK